MEKQKFTKYELARIIGARALQIVMDAPLLIKISDEKLKEMRYDALKIAEYELSEEVLPITISRPSPRKTRDKLTSVKEDNLSDEELIAKAQEVEKEIVEDAKQFGNFSNEIEEEEAIEGEASTTEER
ncbi:MAG: DNA-directed RNA polymerase subunit K [Nanoarchaeota archaeon]